MSLNSIGHPMFFGQRVDDVLGALDLSLGDLDPNVLRISESWPHVVDVHDISDLSDSLNAPFPLLQSGWIPREVEVNERAQPLFVCATLFQYRKDVRFESTPS